jgi:hypothetical protein
VFQHYLVSCMSFAFVVACTFLYFYVGYFIIVIWWLLSLIALHCHFHYWIDYYALSLPYCNYHTILLLILIIINSWYFVLRLLLLYVNNNNVFSIIMISIIIRFTLSCVLHCYSCYLLLLLSNNNNTFVIRMCWYSALRLLWIIFK